VSEDDQDCRNM